MSSRADYLGDCELLRVNEKESILYDLGMHLDWFSEVYSVSYAFITGSPKINKLHV